MGLAIHGAQGMVDFVEQSVDGGKLAHECSVVLAIGR
jgi:hypothetical protein